MNDSLIHLNRRAERTIRNVVDKFESIGCVRVCRGIRGNRFHFAYSDSTDFNAFTKTFIDDLDYWPISWA